MYRLLVSILFLSVLFTACQEDQFAIGSTQEIDLDVPSSLAPYFTEFKSLASKYNLDVDYESAGVTAEIKKIGEGSVAGTCSTNGHDLRHIIIDSEFWNSASQMLREMIVFHELGHCILNRGHEEGEFENGICKSIMRSGLGGCKDAYIPANRDYFIQELFVSD